jgi:hypothetical protein
MQSVKGRVTYLEKRSPGLFPLPANGDLSRFTDDQLTYAILQGVYEVTGNPNQKPVFPLPEIADEALLHVVNTLPDNWKVVARD